MKDKIKDYRLWICLSAVLLSVLIVTTRHYQASIADLQAVLDSHASVSMSNTESTLTTEIQASQKVSNDEPDLTLSQNYVATINGHKVTVPVQHVSKSDTKGTTVTLQQDIDVSTLVKPLVPKWEIGVGIGVHKADVYVPVAIQRNYKIDRAVEAVIHLDSRNCLKPNGVTVMHKWCF